MAKHICIDKASALAGDPIAEPKDVGKPWGHRVDILHDEFAVAAPSVLLDGKTCKHCIQQAQRIGGIWGGRGVADALAAFDACDHSAARLCVGPGGWQTLAPNRFFRACACGANTDGVGFYANVKDEEAHKAEARAKAEADTAFHHRWEEVRGLLPLIAAWEDAKGIRDERLRAQFADSGEQGGLI